MAAAAATSASVAAVAAPAAAAGAASAVGSAAPAAAAGAAAPLARNTEREYVGAAGVIARHAAQIADFEKWAARRDWSMFHRSHYDWWAFPIDERSGGQGWRYTVLPGDVAELQRNAEFMASLRRGVELLALSWGWDLAAGKPLPPTALGRDQRWANWPVRLYKATKCMRLFGFTAEFASLVKLGRSRIAGGDDFSYGGHDMSWLFKLPIEVEAPAAAPAPAAAVAGAGGAAAEAAAPADGEGAKA